MCYIEFYEESAERKCEAILKNNEGMYEEGNIIY